MDYKNMQFADIVAWCKANNQVDWLRAEMDKKTMCKVYPRVEKNGKWVADKTQPYTLVERDINFMQVKLDFIEMFMPELKPTKKKKPTMAEIVANL